ncbi:MAG: helix-hairpin-helix domain-containing protein [Nitrospirales bacterium]|nr:helix-hairpin-helix domain-containing protein [Nitrospirales bacterium]
MKQRLQDVVISCVNRVGVDVNMASPQLLTAVSGVGPQLAMNIVAYRQEHGPFVSRTALKNVPRLGAKAFEQAAGFLRITDGSIRWMPAPSIPNGMPGQLRWQGA